MIRMLDAPIMLPPDDGWSGGEAAPYDVLRGTCLVCGSGDVVHLVIGMPVFPEDWESGPEWVHWVGCVNPGWDRECSTCRARWSVDESLILRDRTAKGGVDHLVLSPRQKLLSMEGVTFVLLHHLSNMVRYRPQQVESLRMARIGGCSPVDRSSENFLLSMASRMSLEEHLIL